MCALMEKFHDWLGPANYQSLIRTAAQSQDPAGPL
jgi:hypothetical protein